MLYVSFSVVTRSLVSCLVRSIVHFLIRSLVHYLGTKTQVISSKLFSLVNDKRLLNNFTKIIPIPQKYNTLEQATPLVNATSISDN